MNWLNGEFSGYASSPREAACIIHQTGWFYISVGIAYLLSFIFKFFNSTGIRKRAKIHLTSIALWGVAGAGLVSGSDYYAAFISCMMVFYALFALYTTQFPAALMTHYPVQLFDEHHIENKKCQYALTLVKKRKMLFKDMFESALVNDQILWLLILYKSGTALRASLAF